MAFIEAMKLMEWLASGNICVEFLRKIMRQGLVTFEQCEG